MELLKKIIQFTIGNIIILVIGVITTPIITHLVLPEELGQYSLFNTIGNLCVLLCMMGTDQAFMRFYYEESELTRIKLSKVFMKFCIINATILSLFICLFRNQISYLILGMKSYPMIIVLCVFILFNIIYNVVLLQLRIDQKLNMYNALHTLQKMFYLIFAIFSYKIGFLGLMIAITFSYMYTGILGILLEKKLWLSSKTKNIMLKHSFKEMLAYGGPLFFSSIIAWVFQATDKIMLKVFSDFRELGLYTSAAEIIVLLNAVQSAFATFWIPLAYEQYLKDPENTKFFTRVNQIISVIMFCMAVLLIMGKDILGLILGSKYTEAIYIFPFLVFMPIMYTISETTVLGINFKKKTTYHVWISIISSLSNIILNAFLIPLYGARGAAIGTGLAYFIHWGGRTAFSFKCYNVDYNLKKCLISSLLAYGFAAYASFHKFDRFIFTFGLCLLFIICFLYRDIFLVALRKEK